jgi:hypothetical protein
MDGHFSPIADDDQPIVRATVAIHYRHDDQPVANSVAAAHCCAATGGTSYCCTAVPKPAGAAPFFPHQRGRAVTVLLDFMHHTFLPVYFCGFDCCIRLVFTPAAGSRKFLGGNPMADMMMAPSAQRDSAFMAFLWIMLRVQLLFISPSNNLF